MEAPLAPGAAHGSIRAPSPAPPAMDPQIIVDHLEKVLAVSLGASHADLDASGSLLSPARRADTIQRCARFAAEGQSVLYLIKDKNDGAQADALETPNGKLPYPSPAHREGTTMLTPCRHSTPLHLHSLYRIHRLSLLCRLCCPFQAPDTHRSRDTPQCSSQHLDVSRL